MSLKNEQFGALLKSIFERQNATLYAFCAKSGISRVMLQQVFAGKRALPEAMLQTILREANFTAGQREDVRSAYYSGVYGKEAYERLRYIHSALRKLTDEENAEELPVPGNHPPVEAKSYAGDELYAIISSMLARELTKNAPWVYTNFSYSDTKLDESIYAILQKNRKPDTQFIHTLTIESENASSHNLRNIFASVKYLKLGFSPIVFQSREILCLPDHYARFYFSTSDAVLFFSPDYRCGVVVQDRVYLDFLSLASRQVVTEAPPLAQFSKDEVAVAQMFGQMSGLVNTGVISYAPCFSAFATAEHLSEALTDDLPTRAVFVSWYERVCHSYWGEGDAPAWFFLDGIRNFAATGRIPDASAKFLKEIPKPLRAKAISIMIDQLRENPESFLMLNETELQFPQDLALNYSENILILYGKIHQDATGFLGEYSIPITDPQTLVDFHNFQDFCRRNNFIHTADYTIKAMEMLLLEQGLQ
jgi:transcriptional regulator with XRE-family HTH domain